MILCSLLRRRTKINKNFFIIFCCVLAHINEWTISFFVFPQHKSNHLLDNIEQLHNMPVMQHLHVFNFILQLRQDLLWMLLELLQRDSFNRNRFIPVFAILPFEDSPEGTLPMFSIPEEIVVLQLLDVRFVWWLWIHKFIRSALKSLSFSCFYEKR